MGRITLVTGGARSGKSSLALQRGKESKLTAKLFIATAEVLDEEMQLRAENHSKERGPEWETVEEPCNVADRVKNLSSNSMVLIDCCTVWLGNIWHKYGNDDTTLSYHIDMLCKALENWADKNKGEIIVVSNEVGWGIIPADAGVRRYRDWAGKLNQKIASISHEVILCVAGIPMRIKDEG